MRAYSKFKFILIFVIGIAKLCLGANSTLGCIKHETQSLRRFKESVYDPLYLLFSSEGNNCCQWNGVWCDAVKGHVVRLDLRFNLETSSFPYPFSFNLLLNLAMDDPNMSIPPLTAKEAVDPSLQELEYLNYLDLSGNYFQRSPIATFIGSTKHLRYLNLSHADFTRKVPHLLGNLTKLCVLDLSGNFGLHIDDFSWVIQLSSLQHLDLRSVDLSKMRNLVKLLNMLPSLLELILIECKLYNVHFEISNAFPNMTALRILDLTCNNLRSIPSLFFKLKSLVQLSLGENSVGFSDAIQNMTSLKFLDLSYNQISIVPWWMGKLCKFVHLNLVGNELGSILNVVRNLTFVRFLELGHNKLDL